MDRWGPSEDCPICGQPQSFGHLVVCGYCERKMCEWCRTHEHGCYDALREQGNIELLEERQ